MPDFSSLLTLNYWFDLRPVPMPPMVEQSLFGFFALLLVAGIVLRVWARRNRREDRFEREALARVMNLLTTMGLLGLLWLFFSYEQVSLFGARFWLLVWLAGTGAWLAVILKKLYGVAPKVRVAERARAEKAKYLPKAKK